MTSPTETEFTEIMGYLNKKYHKKFTVTEPHRKLMRARFKEGLDAEKTIAEIVEDFKKAIDNQLNDPYFQKNPKYYRPQTLFNGNFDSYVNNNPIAVGMAPGEMKEKVVKREPDPMADNVEFNDAMAMHRENRGKPDKESLARTREAQTTMERLNKEAG